MPAELILYGDIGESFFGESILAKDVVAELNKMRREKEIVVRINSGGGDVFEATAIYNALRTAGPKVVTQNDALAASAASLILTAGDEIRVAENSLIMTHSARTVGFMIATSTDLRSHAATLDRINEMLISTYARRSKTPGLDVANWVRDDESWFTAQQAIDVGLADSIGPRMNAKASLRPWLLHCPVELEPCVVDVEKRSRILREYEARLRQT